MARTKVTLENFADVVSKTLEDYGEEVVENMTLVTKTVAQKGVSALRSSAGSHWSGKKGKRYSSGWRVWYEQTRLGMDATIYNTAMPGLAHLLEHGHETVSGGRTRAIVHISPIEQEIVETYQREVEKRL